MGFSGSDKMRPRSTSPFSHSPNHEKRRTREISCSKPFLNEGCPENDVSHENQSVHAQLRNKFVTFEDSIGNTHGLERPEQDKSREAQEVQVLRKGTPRAEIRDNREKIAFSISSEKNYKGRQRTKPSKHKHFRPSLEPILSVPTSRRSTIAPDQLPRGAPAISTNDASKTKIDEVRKTIEDQFYLQSGEEPSKARRRSLMRTVSKEDYLLVRGANPRTGIVTPGVQSAASSYEEVEILKAHGTLQPAKWRQRGDQWISLAPGQPSPIESPLQESEPSIPTRPLRTPQKLAADKFNGSFQDTINGRLHETRREYQRQPRNELKPYHDSTPIPGTYPVTPQKHPTSSLQNLVYTESAIRRKPVGNSPSNYNDGSTHRSPNPSSDTVIVRPFTGSQARSSSAPTTRQEEYFSPDDVGKNLPPIFNRAQQFVPGHIDDGRMSNEMPFLGRHQGRWPADWIEDVPRLVAWNRLGLHGDKHPPCLPMKSGLSRWPHSSPADTVRTTAPSRNWMMVDETDCLASQGRIRATTRPSGLRTEASQQRHFIQEKRGKPIIPCRKYLLIQDARKQMKRDTARIEIPIYHGHPPTNMRGRVSGPRTMVSRKERDVFTSPCNITSTSTSMNTCTTTSTNISTQKLPIPVERSLEQMSNNMSEEVFPEHVSEDVQTQTVHPSMRPSQDEHLSPKDVCREAPRRESRPPLPNRAGGTNRIPVVNAKVKREEIVGTGDVWEIDMEDRHQWRMTGMQQAPEQSEEHHYSSQIGTGPLTESTKIAQTAGCSRFPSLLSHKTHFLMEVTKSSPQIGPTGTCGQWQSGYGGQGQEVSIGSRSGVIHTLEDPAAFSQLEDSQSVETKAAKAVRGLTEETYNITPASRRTSFDRDDERDHTRCCPDCCRFEDCHEGCLGHPSPNLDSVRTVKGRMTETCTTDTPVTPVTDGSELNLDIQILSRTRHAHENEPKKPTHESNIKFRKTSRKNKRSSRTSPTVVSSPGSFWGGDGAGGVAGAMAAAKRAMGYDGNVKKGSSVVYDSHPAMRESQGRVARRAISSGGSRLATFDSFLHPLSENPGGTRSTAKFRNVSGASLMSIDIPGFSGVGIGTLGEIIVVTTGAVGMWIRNHPEFRTYLFVGCDHAWDMMRTITRTATRVWRLVRIYSQTGRICLDEGKKGSALGHSEPSGLLFDVLRTALYLLIFAAVAVVVGRVMKVLMGLGGAVYAAVRLIFWLLGKIVGCGILW